MGTLILYISLTCLVHVTLGSPLDCSSGIRGIPPNFKRLNGLWNLKAIIGESDLHKLTHSYSNIRVSEKEARFWGFLSPTTHFDVGIGGLSSIPLEEGSLAYSYEPIQGVTNIMTFTQTQPESVIFQLRPNNKLKVSALYTKGTSLPQAELEAFKQWGECNGLQGYIEFNITFNYAQTCFGMFHVSDELEEMKHDVSSWHLIAKSSSNADRHYEVRILYKARLEITKKGEEYTLREIITEPTDTTLLELPFTNRGGTDGHKVVAFQTAEGLLLLGVQTDKGKTLYLASKNPSVKHSTIRKFKTQALCFETKYNYFVPLSIENDDGAAENCVDKLKQMVPINFRESIGKWILTVSAHEKTETALQDALALYGYTEISIADDTMHLSHTSIHHGTIYLLEKNVIEVDESAGHILYKDTPQGTRAFVYRVSSNCIMFSPERHPGKLYLNCHKDETPSAEEIAKFVHYAHCLKYFNIVLRKHSSASCSDLPDEVEVLDVEKVAGKWSVAAVASNVPQEDVQLPPEIQFDINDGDVFITDGNWRSPAVKINDRRLQYAKGEESTMEMRFHGPVEDSLLVWVGNIKENKVFVVLFSKSGLVKPEDRKRFKHLSACLSIPVTFVKE